MAKGGRGGRRRTGATGGLNPNDIISTTSLISEREAKQREVDDSLTVFREVFSEYGAIVNDIELATLKPRASGVMAYYDANNNIAVNVSYFDNAKMEQAYKLSVDMGFHPSNGNKTALQAVVAHELGHKLTADVATKMGKQGFLDLDSTAKVICEEARKNTKHRGVVQMAEKISGYALQSNAEAIAEAFSDVYCNGKKAHKESRAIVDVINKYLK